MVAPLAISFIEIIKTVKIANYRNAAIIIIKINVLLYIINIIVHYDVYQVSIRPVCLIH